LPKIPLLEMNHQQQEQQHLREEDQSNLIDDDCRESVSPDRRPVKVVKRSRYKRIRKKIGFKHLWSVLGIVFYTLLGGVLFLFVERPVDLHERQQLYAVYQTSQKDLIKQLEQLGENYAKNRDREYFLSQLQTAILGYEAKIDVHVSNESLWDFWNAMYYAGTVYTTIGYGNVACKTTIGRVMTVFYALIGIPLVLTRLHTFGQVLFVLMHWMTNRMLHWLFIIQAQIRIYHRNRLLVRRGAVRRESAFAAFNSASSINRLMDPSTQVTVIPIEKPKKWKATRKSFREQRIPVWTALVFTIAWIFLCAGVFTLWERWTYFEAVYFFFISLSTIGLGDVVPDYPSYMIMNYGLVIIGLSLVTVCINLVQSHVELLYYNLLKRILKEYTKQLAKGNGKEDAHKGMQHMWHSNRLAKLLMPLLSKEKKEVILQRFTDAAEAHGIHLPDAFKELDPDSGLPTLFVPEAQQQQASDLMSGRRRSSDVSPVVLDVETDTELEPTDVLYDISYDPEFYGEVQALQKHVFVDATSQTGLIDMSSSCLTQTTPEEYRLERQMQTEQARCRSVETVAVPGCEVGLLVQPQEMSHAVQTEPAQTCETESQTEPDEHQTDEIMQTSSVKLNHQATITELLDMIEEEIQTINRLQNEPVDQATETDCIPTRVRATQTRLFDRRRSAGTQYDSRLAEFFKSGIRLSSADASVQASPEVGEPAMRRSFSGTFAGVFSNTKTPPQARLPWPTRSDALPRRSFSRPNRRHSTIPPPVRKRAHRSSVLLEQRAKQGLHWHPKDGKHAEPQLPVETLRQFWENCEDS
ncbi:TWiK family of potassium channels protein 18, partial [Trichinella britovi]